MVNFLIICSLVLLLSVMSSRFLNRFGVPLLLGFLILGMVFGSDGLVGIEFSDFTLAGHLATIGLIFIMFYGGFGTVWETARPVAVPSILLATLGVVVTAGLTGIFCYGVLGFSFYESLLFGSVVSSTDAASVFSILRSHKLNLKGGVAPLLEIESGSNDPMSYMLTIIMLTLLNNKPGVNIPLMILSQVVFALIIGAASGWLAAQTLKKNRIDAGGMNTIFVIATVIAAYSLTEAIGGNGYLSVYLVGIILGNSKMPNKRTLVHFFDGLSWLMQIMLFFTLGLLSFPSIFSGVIWYAIPISLFLIFVARPVAVFSILSWFKMPVKQQIFISAVGVRGAASIVFAILAVTGSAALQEDIFHTVFFVALFSVSVQGSIIPFLAKKLHLIDNRTSVLKTFTDYEEDGNTILEEIVIHNDHRLCGKTIAQAGIPSDILVVMIKRGGQTIVPRGETKIQAEDVLVQLSRKEVYASMGS